MSSSTSDVKPSDSNSLNDVKGQLQSSDTILGSFQSGGPIFPQSNNQIAAGQDPDILILPMVPAEEQEEVVPEEPIGGILRSQPVESHVNAGRLTFSARNQLIESSILTPTRTRQQLWLEYRRLQERKRRIYQLLRQFRLAAQESLEEQWVFEHTEWCSDCNSSRFNVAGEHFYETLTLKATVFGKPDELCSRRLNVKIVKNKTSTTINFHCRVVSVNLIGSHIELRIFPMINCLCILLNSTLYLTLSIHVCFCINFLKYILIIKSLTIKIQLYDGYLTPDESLIWQTTSTQHNEIQYLSHFFSLYQF